MSAAPSTDPVLEPKTGIVLAMLLAIVVVAALAYWDDQRESAAAFDDFAHEQAILAQSVAGDVAARIEAARASGSALPDGSALIFGAARIERPSELILLLLPPGKSVFVTSDGGSIVSEPIARALAGSDTSVRLSRPDAAALGLPARVAVAGLSRLDEGAFGHYGVAVVATASRERDREMRARSRLLLSVGLASGLVFVFGSFALRRQRKELELERELALAEMQQRRDERLVRAGRIAMMGTLATGVAHEIGTPLGVIAGRAEQILSRMQIGRDGEPASSANSGNDEERTRKSAQAILDQTVRIGEVVRGFLDLARGGEPVLGAASPSSIVDGAVRLVQHRFEKAFVELRIEIAPSLPNVQCDGRLIEHALVNLLLNGCEACAHGGVVSIAVAAVEDDEGAPLAVSFLVIDDGVGITQEDAARATEPFFTTKPVGVGTGLGLAITHEIVASHHGTLTIGPELPHGTRACIRLPSVPAEARDAEG